MSSCAYIPVPHSVWLCPYPLLWPGPQDSSSAGCFDSVAELHTLDSHLLLKQYRIEIVFNLKGFTSIGLLLCIFILEFYFFLSRYLWSHKCFFFLQLPLACWSAAGLWLQYDFSSPQLVCLAS